LNSCNVCVHVDDGDDDVDDDDGHDGGGVHTVHCYSFYGYHALISHFSSDLPFYIDLFIS